MPDVIQIADDDVIMKDADSMLRPIGLEGAGDDPRYGDNFILVKTEIDRLADTDYAEVVRLCERILAEESKDLRVAGYYLLAKTFVEGLEGLLETAELYLNLVLTFGVKCHPQRESARYQAIAWLNNEKILAFISNTGPTSDAERSAITRLSYLVESLNEAIVHCYGDAVTKWTSLNPWIEKHLPKEPATSEERLSKSNVQEIVKVPEEKKEISSDLAFTRSAEEMYAYLAKKRDWSRLVAMSRALKWSSVVLPLHEEGVTRLSPPRQQIIAETMRDTEQDCTENQLVTLESYFHEKGCQYFLDLQKREAELAIGLGMPEISDLIKEYVRVLVLKAPEIVGLSYSDGTTFANESTRQWIKRLNAQQSTAKDSKKKSAEFQQRIDDILESSGGAGLSTMVARLEALETRDRSEEFRIGLAKIDLCMIAGRFELALLLSEQLEKQVERYRLYEWQKNFAIEVWDRLLVILKRKASTEKEDQMRMDELKGKICNTDFGYALDIF